MSSIAFVVSALGFYTASRPRQRLPSACATGASAPSAREPLVPPTYEAMYRRSARASRLYVEAGDGGPGRAAEIEFPPIPVDDGSASARGRERASHSRLAAAMARELGARAAVVAFDQPTLRLVRAEGVNVTLWPELGAGDVVVGVAPSADEEWLFLERQTAERNVVVANGLFNNGQDWLETAFYLRPCSGWGCLVKEYPNDWTAVSGRTGEALPVHIALLTQGKIRRPDLPTASKACLRDFYA